MLLAIALSTSGCYLAHVGSGQARLLWAREPIARVLSDPATPVDVRERLELVVRVRRYAEGLGLDVGERYQSYVPWPGDRIVTTVVATRPREVEPEGFWFPIVGTVPYKGYFDADRADSEADRLRAKDRDVCVVPVRAYSTLGWFDDPVTGPMLRQTEARLTETLLHELVHATAFVASDADFNEGVASFIGEEARVRFRTSEGRDEREERERVEENRLVRAEILRARGEVEALYAESPDVADEERRAAIERVVRQRISVLPLRHADPSGLAERIRLNDACLALAGTYGGRIADFTALLDDLGGDLSAFVARLRDAALADDPSRALLGERAREQSAHLP